MGFGNNLIHKAHQLHEYFAAVRYFANRGSRERQLAWQKARHQAMEALYEHLAPVRPGCDGDYYVVKITEEDVPVRIDPEGREFLNQGEIRISIEIARALQEKFIIPRCDAQLGDYLGKTTLWQRIRWLFNRKIR